MKKIIRLAFTAILFMAMPLTGHAQLTNILKNAASTMASNAVSNVTNSSSTSTVVSSLLNSVLGTSTVSESNIAGTWTYSEPCVVAESDNILSNLVATTAANKASTYLKSGLTRIGFTQGKVVLTLNSDKTATMSIKGRAVNGTWSVSGSNLTLTNTLTGKSVTMNVSLSGSNLQIAMNASKLVTLLQTFGSNTSSATTSLSTVTKLLSKVKGLYVGLKFTK